LIVLRGECYETIAIHPEARGVAELDRSSHHGAGGLNRMICRTKHGR
jgi:hypothetical protein